MRKITEKTAISILNSARPRKGSYERLQVAFDMAIKALEKQIPKKPTDISEVRDCERYIGLIGRCPCCAEILEEDTVYCDCGQKLDWSAEDEKH